MEQFTEMHSNGRLLALPTDIRLGWTGLEVSNALAYYYDTATVMTVKSFIVQEGSVLQNFLQSYLLL